MHSFACSSLTTYPTFFFISGLISLKFKGTLNPERLAEVDTIGFPKVSISLIQKLFFGTLNAIDLLFPNTKSEMSFGLSNINVVGESSEI